MIRFSVRPGVAPAALAALALAGCERNPLVVKRSACPAVAVADYVSDVTLFRPGTSPATLDAGNVDVEATITNVRHDCVETAEQFVTRITYDVVARRSDAGAARQAVLPVFAAVVQAGNIVNAKQLSNVAVDFAAGQDRAVGRGQATASVSRRAAAVPQEIMDKINRNRRPGQLDAATDPMSDPEVRAALKAASFEVLIGFQLDDRALAYNVAK